MTANTSTYRWLTDTLGTAALLAWILFLGMILPQVDRGCLEIGGALQLGGDCCAAPTATPRRPAVRPPAYASRDSSREPAF
jgi:hypothetical protein